MSDEASFNDLCDTLWYQLDCRCEQCGTQLDLTDIDRLKDRDTMAWSRVAAERATELGWQPIAGAIAVCCPTCAALRN